MQLQTQWGATGKQSIILIYLLTNSYHTQTFIDKDALESKDWFPKLIKYVEFYQDEWLKEKCARNRVIVGL